MAWLGHPSQADAFPASSLEGPGQSAAAKDAMRMGDWSASQGQCEERYRLVWATAPAWPGASERPPLRSALVRSWRSPRSRSLLHRSERTTRHRAAPGRAPGRPAVATLDAAPAPTFPPSSPAASRPFPTPVP